MPIYVTCGGLIHIDVLTLPRQTLVRPAGYERSLPERVTQIALYSAVTSKENQHLQPSSTIYSGYSAHVVMMQYGNTDVKWSWSHGADLDSKEFRTKTLIQ